MGNHWGQLLMTKHRTKRHDFRDYLDSRPAHIAGGIFFGGLNIVLLVAVLALAA